MLAKDSENLVEPPTQNVSHFQRIHCPSSSGIPNFNLRQKLITDKILQETDGGYLFSRDHHFDSSSAAAATCCGGATNGPNKWKDTNGYSLRNNREKAITEQK
ncbi:MAG: DUF4357 domain-containing protein [Rhodothermaceae bacterium]|nr:DUF4357 domain-containing protein [Rhodothermaceae bacterium]MXW33677.1 DUF4357 domain-containing protein [Rhodothermaceae bacterium]MXZ16861.1 DUF4357 domain-containing protein [Rhodothermaceae bacterium]MYC03194.1 DUF4357 domain-containing protein [Rhodothermaceae bacterium]MYE62829.1 DUF4357 domain-containing protein [Rhodothermaceae bacterium]